MLCHSYDTLQACNRFKFSFKPLPSSLDLARLRLDSNLHERILPFSLAPLSGATVGISRRKRAHQTASKSLGSREAVEPHVRVGLP